MEFKVHFDQPKVFLDVTDGMHTLESRIDVGQGINIGPGIFVKKNKRRVLNKHRA